MCRGGSARPYSLDDERLVEEVATIAALGISNAQLFTARLRELRERNRVTERLRVLSQASRDFAAATGDSLRLLDLVAERLGTMVGDACLLRMVSSDGEALETTGSLYDHDPGVAAALRETLLQRPQRRGEGIGGRVLATGRPMIVHDTAEGANPEVHRLFAEALSSHGITKFLGVPLLSRGRVIGVITMARRRASAPFSEEDQSFVCELAAHASLAVHNSRLVESLQRELDERRRAEDALRRTEAQFRQAQKMEAVGRLAGGVAHDFNNLLTVVLSNTELLLDGLDRGDAMREDIEQIQHAGERAAGLTRQLLAFSRKQVMEPRVLDLGAVVEGMAGLLGRLLGEDIRLSIVPCEGALWRCLADPGQLEQVVMNLAVNARDAMPEGGRLTIETRNVYLDAADAAERAVGTPGPHVLLAVSDTGHGMDRETQSRIFEPFFTTKDQARGTGLGLSTVLGIVEQSGGHIQVSSEPAKGTTFKIYLPRASTQTVQSVVSAGDAPVARDCTETIVVAEDDAPVREIVCTALRGAGYRVLEASSAEEALGVEQAHRGPIDLLVTDVVMTGMGGRRLAARLQSLRPRLRVLFMSGYTEDAIIRHGVLEAGVAFLAKPATPSTLLRKVRSVLDARGAV